MDETRISLMLSLLTHALLRLTLEPLTGTLHLNCTLKIFYIKFKYCLPRVILRMFYYWIGLDKYCMYIQ